MNNKNKTYKIVGIIIICAVIIVGIFTFYNRYKVNDKVEIEDINNPMDISYTIDGTKVQLKDGYAESEAAPNSASKIVTKYFGNELKTDLNNDGREDIAFIITQNTGGSGTFFYAVAALNTKEGYVGSDGYLLGDRIAPQTTEMSKNPNQKDVVIFNYMDRKLDDPMTTAPSVGKSAYLKLVPENMQWAIVEPNFEGEADPSHMNLNMKTWKWTHTLYSDNSKVTPKIANKFTLTFKPDKTFSATTDCNNISGQYAVANNTITFSNMISTLMYCEGSQEQDFTKMLNETQSYIFTSKGELVLELKNDSGSVFFK